MSTMPTADSTPRELAYAAGWELGYSSRPLNPYAYRENSGDREAYVLGHEHGTVRREIRRRRARARRLGC